MRTYQDLVKELYYSVHSDGTNFTAQLFRLIAKADHSNRERLSNGFPLEVQVWEDWQKSPSEIDFFKSNGAQ